MKKLTPPRRLLLSATDPEEQAQGNELHGASRVTRGVIWLVFLLIGAWAGFQGWCQVQRRCAWCKRRIAGSPFTKHVTHGMCATCAADWQNQAEGYYIGLDEEERTAALERRLYLDAGQVPPSRPPKGPSPSTAMLAQGLEELARKTPLQIELEAARPRTRCGAHDRSRSPWQRCFRPEGHPGEHLF